MKLKDKVILITGSSTGIGKATAELCIKEGAKVMIHGLDEIEAKQTADILGQPYLAIDLALAESSQLLFDYTLAHYGRLDGLVNNAATVARSTLESLTAEFFNNTIAINLRAPVLIIKAAIAQFKAQGGAAIVNIGSTNAYCGHPNLLPYSISKGGLMTMTRNLANAYAKDNIRVNQINLGWVLSENEVALQISEGQTKDWYEHLSADYAPSGSLIKPEEIAKHVVFWLSDDSAPASGAIFEAEQYPIIGRPR